MAVKFRSPITRLAPPTEDPRRRQSGTSYEAGGSVETPPNALAELGSANAPGIIRETVPELRTLNRRLQTYERMLNNDSTVDISVRSAKVPVMGANFFVQPFSDRPDHKEQAEFAEFNIFSGTITPFLQILEEALRMIEQGFSIFEPVWEIREWAPKRTMANRRKYTMIRKIAPRPANTLKEFLYDANGGPVGIVQNAIDDKGKSREVEIPIDKLIVFTLNKRGGNLEGKSVLRTAYKHWWYKEQLYKIDGIQKERHAIGVPRAKLAPGYTKADADAALMLVQNLRTNEHAGIVSPPGYDIDFAKPEGELVDVIKSIEHHDSHIALNVFVQFLLLGLQGGGGRATSGSHMDMFMKSLRYLGSFVCDVFNLYLMPKLIGYNFDTDQFPTLRVRNIGEAKDMQQWAAAMSNLITAGAITMDTATENWMREQTDMPYLEGERPAEIAEPSANGKGQVRPGVRGKGQGNTGKAPDEG